MDRPECKSEAEILDYFSGSWLALLSNQVRFENSILGEQSIIPESRLFWVSINKQLSLVYPFEVKTTMVNLQDELVNLDELTELEDPSIFSLHELPSVPFDDLPEVHVQFII